MGFRDEQWNIEMIWNGCDIMNEYKDTEYDLADKIVGTQTGSNSETYINANLQNNFAAFKTYLNVKIRGFEERRV